MSETYDNTHRGALFTIAENQMEGPFHLNTNDEPDTRALLTVDPEGNEHELAVYETGINGQRKGRPIAKGTIRATERVNTASGNQPPVARGVLHVKGGEKIRVCLWSKDNDRGEFYQLAPDEFEPSKAPSLANAQ